MQKSRYATSVGLALVLTVPTSVMGTPNAPILDTIQIKSDLTTHIQDQTELGALTKNTPRSGSVIDREELDRVQFVDSVNELLNRIPGTSLTRNMRIPIGGRSYTGNLIDGQTPRSPHQLGTWGFIEEINTWDIERIEITRGPGSVLNSSNAVGGTINIITRDPPAQAEHRIWGQIGQWDLYRGGASTGGTLDNGLGYLFNVNSMRDHGWREHSSRERDALSGTLQYHPGENTRLRMRMEYLDVYDEDPGNLSKEAFDADWRQAAVKHDVLSDQMEHLTPSFRVNHFLSDSSELKLGYIHRSSTGTQVTQGFGQTAGAALRQTEKDYSEHNLQVIYRQDFQPLAGKLNIGADLIRGTKKDDRYDREDQQRGAINRLSDIRETGRSPFAQYEFSPVDRLRLTAGIRYEDFKYDVKQLSFDRQGNEVHHDGSSNYAKMVKKGGLVFKINEHNRLWANLSEGFRVPATSATVTASYPNPDLPPETMLTREIGLRGFLPDYQVNYDLTLYQTDIDDYHLSVYCIDQPDRCAGFNPNAPGANRATFTDAAGKLRFRGFEAELGWQATNWLRFDAAYTLATSKLQDYVNRGEDYSGNSLNAMPRHRLNARATISPVANTWVELEADYISEIYTSMDNINTYNRPTLYNLRAGYRHGNWDFTLTALNLFDQKYTPRVSESGGEFIYNAGYNPLTVRAGLSYNW